MITFPTQSLVRLEMVYKCDKDVGYFREDKGKNKRERDSPKKDDLESKAPQEELTQAPKNEEPQEEVAQAQDIAKVPPLE